MKSRVLAMKDPRTVDLSAFFEPFVVDQEQLDRELARSTNAYIRWEKGNKVFNGDMVVCHLVSDCPRFNKDRVKFVVCSGMFHREVETLTVGMSVGETRQIVLPEGNVSVTLAEVTNKIVPPISDELVEQMGMENIHTVADYTEYLIQQQREQHLNRAVYKPLQYLTSEVIAGSEFILHQTDWQRIVDMRLERARVLFRREGLVLEEVTAEQLQGRVPAKSYYELVALEQQSAWQSLCLYLLGRHLAQEDGFVLNRADYEQYIQQYMKNWHLSEAEAQEIETYEFYEFYLYGNHATERLGQIVRQKLMEE